MTCCGDAGASSPDVAADSETVELQLSWSPDTERRQAARAALSRLVALAETAATGSRLADDYSRLVHDAAKCAIRLNAAEARAAAAEKERVATTRGGMMSTTRRMMLLTDEQIDLVIAWADYVRDELQDEFTSEAEEVYETLRGARLAP